MGYTLRPPLGCWSLYYFSIWHHLIMVPRECVCVCVCVCNCVSAWLCLGVIFGLLLFVETRYSGLRQIGLISLKWGSLFGAFPVDSKQQISFGGSGAVYGLLLFCQGCCSFSQYNLQDRMLRLISNPTLY